MFKEFRLQVVFSVRPVIQLSPCHKNNLQIGNVSGVAIIDNGDIVYYRTPGGNASHSPELHLPNADISSKRLEYP